MTLINNVVARATETVTGPKVTELFGDPGTWVQRFERACDCDDCIMRFQDRRESNQQQLFPKGWGL